MNIEVKQEVLNQLKKLPVCIPNNTKKQWVVRCCRCPDSKNPTHGHLSIKIDLNDDSPMVYRCFKCDTSGLVTSTFLEELGISLDYEFNKNLKAFNKHAMKVARKYNIFTEAPELGVPLYESDRIINKKKLAYFNQRLGTDIDFKDARDLKLILNLFEFVRLNNIESLPASDGKLKLLNNNYIGFLSSNNNCITFRNIYNDKYPRYLKLNINENIYNPNSFYNIPVTFDPLYTNEVNVHVSEGTFDIASVYLNVMNKELKNNFYFASCGFGLVTVLKYLLSIGLNTGINLHIYGDNDKTDEEIIKLMYPVRDTVMIWIDKVFIHRNMFEHQKDYGISKDFIIDQFKKIK